MEIRRARYGRGHLASNDSFSADRAATTRAAARSEDATERYQGAVLGRRACATHGGSNLGADCGAQGTAARTGRAEARSGSEERCSRRTAAAGARDRSEAASEGR